MEKIYLQIKAWYTNLPTALKIILLAGVTQSLGLVSTLVNGTEDINWQLVGRQLIGIAVATLLNVFLHIKLIFTNQDVKTAEKSKDIGIESSTKSTPVDIIIT